MEEFSLKENGELFIRWNINTNYSKLNFNELITVLIREYRQTGSVYDAFIENDGKLIGNEKIAIIRNIKDILQLSIVLKNLLLNKYIKKEPPAKLLTVEMVDEYSFQLTHKYSHKDIAKITSVKHWYEHYFKIQILNLTEELKRALDDKVITEDEAIGLSKTLDEIVLSAIVLYHKLLHENIMN